MTVGAVATVPVRAAHLLQVVESLPPVRHRQARVMRSRLLENYNNTI